MRKGIAWIRENPHSWFMAYTNACPSIHVSSSVAIALVGWNSQLLKRKRGYQILLAVWAVLICMSTLFIKQHSVVDVFWGTIISLALYGILCLLEDRTAGS